MVNESLGAICDSHVVHADRSDREALDENCIKLAKLAASAVDFPKKGKIVTMPSRLETENLLGLYEEGGVPDLPIKKREKIILGRFYRKVRDAYDEEALASTELTLNTSHMTDLEITGSRDFICVFIRCTMDLEFQNLGDDERNILYEQKASLWYQVCYYPMRVKESFDLQGPELSHRICLNSAESWSNLRILEYGSDSEDYVRSYKNLDCFIDYDNLEFDMQSEEMEHALLYCEDSFSTLIPPMTLCKIVYLYNSRFRTLAPLLCCRFGDFGPEGGREEALGTGYRVQESSYKLRRHIALEIDLNFSPIRSLQYPCDLLHYLESDINP
ncbi:RNA-dependent RNA polymerase, eukaryotic-type [Dillenia turbinata]|uniref:RNA-dependent RNA polymerase n=1 Tax=Dillenia turbinata TaxID=194707 RepID=A0AAN8V6F3_9MAGN